jgi:uncharacterized protein with FMN-binding domain
MKVGYTQGVIMQKKASCLLALVLPLFTFLAASCATPAIEVKNLDFSRLRDGNYQGSYVGSMGKASVSLVVADKKVTAATLTHFESSPVGSPAKAVLARVMAAQSLAVDSVSGATYSSKVILRAVQDALEKGM